MDKRCALALVAACNGAAAQTPATNPMPDGSRDLYLGLGAVSAARYEGARERKLSALPVLQLELSNGIFFSGMSAGMHLSNQPSAEFGPLLAFQPRRSQSGTGAGIGGVDSSTTPTTIVPPGPLGPTRPQTANRMVGMDEIGARLELGGFFNAYLTPQLRLTNSLLYGAGNGHDGARWSLGLQHLASEIAPHHKLALSAGVTIVNRNYNQAFFGVTPAESVRSINRAYQAAGGLKDAHLDVRWNWALSPAWMLTSGLQATRLLGSAKDSPLTERPANLTASTALAYRF